MVIDALQFAVRYDGGGEIALAREEFATEEGSAAWAVEILVTELRRAVALRPRPTKPGQMQPRLWNEQIYNIIRVSLACIFETLKVIFDTPSDRIPGCSRGFGTSRSTTSSECAERIV